MNNVVRQQLWTWKASRLVGGMVRLSKKCPMDRRCSVAMTLLRSCASLRQADPRIDRAIWPLSAHVDEPQPRQRRASS